MKNILIVEDDKLTLEALIETVRTIENENLCLNILTATTGNEALPIIASTPIDLIITGLVMPGMKGIDFIKHIRKFQPIIPIIVVSGGGITHETEPFLKQNVDFYFRKPIEDSEPFINKVLEIIT